MIDAAGGKRRCHLCDLPQRDFSISMKDAAPKLQVSTQNPPAQGDVVGVSQPLGPTLRLFSRVRA